MSNFQNKSLHSTRTAKEHGKFTLNLCKKKIIVSIIQKLKFRTQAAYLLRSNAFGEFVGLPVDVTAVPPFHILLLTEVVENFESHHHFGLHGLGGHQVVVFKPVTVKLQQLNFFKCIGLASSTILISFWLLKLHRNYC